MLRIIIFLKDDVAPHFQFLSRLHQIFIQNIAIHCAIHYSIDLDKLPSTRWGEAATHHDTTSSVLHCGYGVFKIKSCVFLALHILLWIHSKQLDFGLVTPENFVPSSVMVFRVSSCTFQSGVLTVFLQKGILPSPPTKQVRFVICLWYSRLVNFYTGCLSHRLQFLQCDFRLGSAFLTME